ncbi:ferritin family protein [Terrihabitans sp. B22-R8]|uniref:ferritin family protein n=1 Tax=Terrihabitans sp. B22-R8 TaxID=3425128 RepID=UPI00403C1E4F
MSRLKTEPAEPVTSLDELFAIAAAMEQEAAERYAEIAGRLRYEGNQALAEVFEGLAADERGHLENVGHWSRQTKGRDPDPALIRWELPETFDDEGVAAADPQLLNAYRALAMAVRNEERAFAFWSYVAAHAEAADIQHAAEVMAHEELGHVAILRRERRKAFHSGRLQDGEGRDEQDLADLEERLADLLDGLVADAPSREGERLRDLAAEARRHARELVQIPVRLPRHGLSGSPPADPVALAELLTDRYLEIADQLQDEDALTRMQKLAGDAIARLAWLRADLPELKRS